MQRVFLALFGWTIFVPGALALDAEAGKPYDFQVILRIAPHRLLTPTFRRQLQADLRDSLQAAFGSLAQVQVLDADGLPPGAWLDPAALDTHSALNPAKRHFVEVAYAGGQYIVQARQLDGSTGLASPVVRLDRTADRAFVARLITRFIDQDFGAVGTVVGKDGDRVRLRLRGGALPGADLARWVPAGSVFAVVRVVGSPPRGVAEPAALLKAVGEPRDGEVECQFFYRYRDARQRDPLADWQHVGFRALRLGTAAAPVRLRFVDANGLPVTSGLEVRVSPTGFTDPPRDHGAVGSDGGYETAGAYQHVAFVNVSSGSVAVARIPVPVLDNRVITCQVTTAANGEARQMVEIESGNLRQSLSDILHRLREQNRQLDALARATQNREALAKVQAGLDLLDAQLTNLSGEVARLRGEAPRVGANVGPVLEQCDVYLQEIRKRRQRLVQAQDDLEKAVKAEESPDAKDKQEGYLALLRRAEALREEADFDKAIETYEEILQKFGEREQVRTRLDELKKAWELKGEDHRKAREYAYGGWAAVKTVEDVRAQLPKAREAFEVCRNAGDRLTALKLFLVASTTATDIVVQRSEELTNSQSDEDKVNLKQVQKVSDDLQTFIKDLSAFVQKQ